MPKRPHRTQGGRGTSPRDTDRPGFDLTQAGLAASLVGGMLLFTSYVAHPYTLPRFFGVALGAFIAWIGLLVAARRGNPVLRRTPLDLPLAAFVAVAVLSTLFSADKLVAIVGDYDNFLGLASLLLCVALYCAAAQSRAAEAPDRLLRIALAGGALLGLYGLLQRLGVEPSAGAPKALPLGRVFSSSGTPVFLGASLLMLCPLVARFALSNERADRLTAAAAGLPIIAALILTLSRGAYLGALTGCVVYALLSGKVPVRRMGVRAWTAGALVFLCLVAASALFIGRMRPHAQADSGRVQSWLLGVKVYRAHPLLGSGPDTMKAACLKHRTERMVGLWGPGHSPGHAHNDAVQVAATLGTLGLGAYLWVLWALILSIKASLAEDARTETVAALAGSLAGLFVQAKFNPSPLSCLAMASVFAGLCVPLRRGERPHGGPPARPAAWTGVLVCGVVLLAASRFLLAGYNERTATRASSARNPEKAVTLFGKALRLDPWQMSYKEDYVRFLVEWAPRAGSAVQRRQMMEEAAERGREAMAWHPSDARGYHMYGLALLLLKSHGEPDRLEEADRALDQGQSLNPYGLSLMELRMGVARARGDRTKADSLAREIRRVRALSGAGDGG
ncbi:MAG: O-antigen ligase family protein [Elusimicrobiota bacterium]